MSTYYVDLEAGTDGARTALTTVTVSNPAGSITRANKAAHGLVTGAVIDATLFTAWLNTRWEVSVVDASNFDLVGAVWQATADANGTMTPRGGSSKTDAWKTLTTGASAVRLDPGDTLRMMASPDATSLGINGTWTDGPQEATKSITSSTNATPIVVTATAHGYSNGDTVVVIGHATNTKANGVWEVANVAANTFELKNADGTNSVGIGTGSAGTARRINNMRVLLASALTANVAVNGNQGTKTNWTASANVTCTVTTADNREGGECQSIAIAAGFTTGLAAYVPTGTINLSAYKQLSFRWKQTVGTIPAAGGVRLRLCSDAVGAVPVDTFDVPLIGALNVWQAFTVNKGSALGASIQSINLDVVTDNGAQTFLIDNIIAVKDATSADSLSNTSLLSKNTGDETWFALQSINGTRLMLDSNTIARPIGVGGSSLQRGYSGTTATVTTYKRETVKTTMAAAATSAGADTTLQDSGTSALPIAISGGWDRTAMTSQTGETFLDGQNFNGSGISGVQKSFVTIDKVSAFRYGNGFNFSLCNNITVTNAHANNCQVRGLTINQSPIISGSFKSISNNQSGCGDQDDRAVISVTQADSNVVLGLMISGRKSAWTVTKARNNGTYGVQFAEGSAGATLTGMTTSGNGTAGVLNGGGSSFLAGTGENYMIGCTIGESTEVSTPVYTDSRLWSKTHDGTPDNDYCFTDGALIRAETSVRHTASGRAYAIDITSTTRDSNYPVLLEIAKIAVASGGTVTIKAWLRRTNTGLTHNLVVKGGQISGVFIDQRIAMSAAANTWEELTLNFTPGEAGVVCVTTETYGGSSFTGYVDDLTVTQV